MHLKNQSQRIKKKVSQNFLTLCFQIHQLKCLFQNEYVWCRKFNDALCHEKKNVDDLPSLINQAVEQGVKLIACTMSMDVMGITKEELRDDVEYGGVGAYIGYTEQANHNLFI